MNAVSKLIRDLNLESGGRGGRNALARSQGVRPSATYRWERVGVSPERALALNRAYGIPLETLRPDIWSSPPNTDV